MRKFISYFCALLLCSGLYAQTPVETDRFIDAVAEYSEGRFDSALRGFSSLHEEFPQDDAVNYYLGLCEFALNDMEGAELHLSNAVRADSSNAWYLHALASLYSARGDRGKFSELGEKLIVMSPSLYRNPYTLTLLGDAKFSARQDSLALSYYNQALEIDPDYAPAELGKIELLRLQGNYPPFFATLDHFLRNDDVRADIKSNYITAVMDNMDSRFYWAWGDQLGKLVDLCLEMHPEDPAAHLLKVRIYLIKSDYPNALEQCRKMAEASIAASDSENLLQAYYIAGDLCHQLGDARGTYSFYDKVLALDPGYPPVLNNYAYYLSQEGRSLRKALKMSKKSLEAEPDNATYLDTCGWILYLLKKYDEAKPYFKHAMIYGGKDSAVVLEHYSKVLEALGEKDLATYYRSLSEQKKDK